MPETMLMSEICSRENDDVRNMPNGNEDEDVRYVFQKKMMMSEIYSR